KTRETAASDMIDFVGKLRAYARAKRPDFLIFPQNGDRLLEYSRFAGLIAGFAREDLLLGEHDDEERNSERSIEASVARLKTVTAAGKPVLVLEYIEKTELAPPILQEIKGL